LTIAVSIYLVLGVASLPSCFAQATFVCRRRKDA
jgi:hypothetical protein